MEFTEEEFDDLMLTATAADVIITAQLTPTLLLPSNPKRVAIMLSPTQGGNGTAVSPEPTDNNFGLQMYQQCTPILLTLLNCGVAICGPWWATGVTFVKTYGITEYVVP